MFFVLNIISDICFLSGLDGSSVIGRSGTDAINISRVVIYV